MKDSGILVSVLCTAYNHEKFIADAIEGVLKQKTDFRYELIIHEDASTDQTAEIIKDYENRYPEIIKVIYQYVNQYQQCNIYEKYLFPRVQGKYFATCEGDDYWTDEKKLQLQVDFLEAHPDYSMCMHNAVKLNFETGEETLLNTFSQDGTYSQKEQIRAGLGSEFPAFASCVFRTELLAEMPHFFLEQKVLDYPLRQYYASKGSVYYYEKPMSVYRMATPQSYMIQVGKNQSFYNNYTLEMIRFFEKFDNYMGRQYHYLLQNKIISDYFGYCLSIDEEQGKKKAQEHGLNMQIVEYCYQCFSTEHMRACVSKLQDTADRLFIYGVSRLAALCKAKMDELGITVQGYVVSDGVMKPEHVQDKPVYYLSQALADYECSGFVLAVQPVNGAAIVETLKRNGVTCYCEPYQIL